VAAQCVNVCGFRADVDAIFDGGGDGGVVRC